MPTDDDFAAAFSAMQLLAPGESSSNRLRELFPSAEDRRSFASWIAERNVPPRQLSATTFTNFIDNEHLVHGADLSEFVVSTMFHGPYLTIPVASDRELVYRLKPEPLGLMSHDKNCSLRTQDFTHGPLLMNYLLGVNLTVQPRQTPAIDRRRMSRSDESTRSDDENNELAPGFIFYQLGELQCAPHDLAEWQPGEARVAANLLARHDGYDWASTGFYLVARLTAMGRAGGIYAVYDMFPRDEQGKRQPVGNSTWGFLPRSEEEGERGRAEGRVSIARIGDSLGELGYHRPLQLTEQVDYPVELVRVKPAGTPLGAVRERVAESG